jgi:hypothetical protein
VVVHSVFKATCVATHESTTLPRQEGGTVLPTTEPKIHLLIDGDSQTYGQHKGPPRIHKIIIYRTPMSYRQAYPLIVTVALYKTSHPLTQLGYLSASRLYPLFTERNDTYRQCNPDYLSSFDPSFTLQHGILCYALHFCIPFSCILWMMCILFIGCQKIQSDNRGRRECERKVRGARRACQRTWLFQGGWTASPDTNQ